MNTLKTLAVAAVAAVTMAAGASAATVQTGTKSVDITCTKTCAYWDLGLSPDGFSATSGDWLSRSYGNIGNSNSKANRLTFVNNVLGTSYTSQSESSDNISNVDSLDSFSGGDNGGWSGSAGYYLAWGGFDPRYVLIKSDFADNTFTWNATGKGSGLSGVDGFDVAPVPLPAAGFLLLGGLGGLAAMRRRKKA
ncbi:VPLPA-CTERM protein sorting domain protein [Jannaschia seosinensis]|uniref:VPLPA-CTERM protein sorting domain protein n=1 Tax=Jannaschia seosinensis TaxID=313367 RepID=A0A0M7BAK3_9RHOB|nr:VPLPA-CTERM sorting domain-containing protein [Jannaschia seosinensis]CUH39088.1 VPLPA-CTERM protein sorting domain protein [Jannaschia seosinensis]